MYDGVVNDAIIDQGVRPQDVLIAQLTESTYAELPAPGAAGTLRKVTDTVRGVWMDTGSQWAAVNGGVANVRDFGAKGDGVTDDTAAIQAALDTGAPVCIPYGNFVISNALLLRVNRQRLFGCGKGSRLLCAPSSGLFCAVAITENTTDIELDNLTLLGNASSEPAGPHDGLPEHGGEQHARGLRRGVRRSLSH